MRRHLNMDELSTLNNQGWEIASHGVHHYNFLKLTDIELENEIKQSKEQIDSLTVWLILMEQTMPTFNNVFHLITNMLLQLIKEERLCLPMLIN